MHASIVEEQERKARKKLLPLLWQQDVGGAGARAAAAVSLPHCQIV
jgi:hypothetical protein